MQYIVSIFLGNLPQTITMN